MLADLFRPLNVVPARETQWQPLVAGANGFAVHLEILVVLSSLRPRGSAVGLRELDIGGGLECRFGGGEGLVDVRLR
ncbi:MAG: hypothetical protein ACKVK6_14615, partial [bacterium]